MLVTVQGWYFLWVVLMTVSLCVVSVTVSVRVILGVISASDVIGCGWLETAYGNIRCQ